MILADSSLRANLPLWTRDKHFSWIGAAFPELQIFDEGSA
jgi:hypothetical protein